MSRSSSRCQSFLSSRSLWSKANSLYFHDSSRKVPRCCAETKRALRYLLIVIAICAMMNSATLASIGYHISVRQETLIDIFNTSMHLYASASSYKYAIDEIQFIFQCCGHSSYADWFLFDWQVNPRFKKGNSPTRYKSGVTEKRSLLIISRFT